MTVTVVIPARYGAVRLPGKPLLRETGKYLVQHVWEQVVQARGVDRVLIATDDERIRAAVHEFGGEAVMTSVDCPSGTDRIAEVASKVTSDVYINVQGDEPEIDPRNVERQIEVMGESGVRMGTLACRFESLDEVALPGRVKVVVDRRGDALYFSRSAIPYFRDGAAASDARTYLLHLGIYGYRRDLLAEYATWAPTPLEQAEKLEQLRALENGVRIRVGLVDQPSAGIDTAEDYRRFVERWRSR